MIDFETNKPLFTDLVNNFQEFQHKVWNEKIESSVKGLTDDSDYSNVKQIEDLTQGDFEPNDNLLYDVTIPGDWIFSSSEKNHGYDRVDDVITESGVKKAIHHLKNPPALKDGKKGFVMNDCGSLQASARYDVESGKWQIAKNLGNNRLQMKFLANNGKPSRIRVLLRFHPKDLTFDDMKTIEANGHSVDAGDRSSQNEKQKFISGYHGGNKKALYCFNFLNKVGMDYHGLLAKEGVEGAENFLALKSVNGLKDGKGCGHFKKYGEHDVKLACETAVEIAKITGEKEIGATSIECLSQMFSIFTNYGISKNSRPVFNSDELQNFFIAFFKRHNQVSEEFEEEKFGLNDMNVSSGVKDITYINAMTFWPLIVNYYKKIKGVQNGFKSTSVVGTEFCDSTKDKWLHKEVVKLIST